MTTNPEAREAVARAICRAERSRYEGDPDLLQACVVQVAERAKHLRQRQFLRRSGEQAETVREDHFLKQNRSYQEYFQPPSVALARDPAFRCQLKQAVPTRRS